VLPPVPGAVAAAIGDVEGREDGSLSGRTVAFVLELSWVLSPALAVAVRAMGQ
jgi:hypothetical protein